MCLYRRFRAKSPLHYSFNSRREGGQVELAEALAVAEDVDLDDPPVPDREGHDRERLAFERADRPGQAVDEDRAPDNAEERIGLGSTSHVLRTADLDQPACTGITSEDHVRVEDGD